jgi:hypothetical protein
MPSTKRQRRARHGQNFCELALNRKTLLFAGSDGGLEHCAVVASLIETCRVKSVDPHGCIADVLTRIVSKHPNSQIEELLLWAYVTAQELEVVA